MFRVRSRISTTLGTVSTMSLAAISVIGLSATVRSGMAQPLASVDDSIWQPKKVVDGASQLLFGVWLAKTVRAFDKQLFHSVSDEVSRRVEHAQMRSNSDSLLRQFAAAKHRRLQVDVSEKRVDALTRMQLAQRLSDIAGRKDVMAPFPDRHFC